MLVETPSNSSRIVYPPIRSSGLHETGRISRDEQKLIELVDRKTEIDCREIESDRNFRVELKRLWCFDRTSEHVSDSGISEWGSLIREITRQLKTFKKGQQCMLRVTI